MVRTEAHLDSSPIWDMAKLFVDTYGISFYSQTLLAKIFLDLLEGNSHPFLAQHMTSGQAMTFYSLL